MCPQWICCSLRHVAISGVMCMLALSWSGCIRLGFQSEDDTSVSLPDGGTDTSAADGATADAPDAVGHDAQHGAILVQAAYPGHPRWNDYVMADNGGTTRFDQPDEACPVDTPGKYMRCIHSGELRRVVFADLASCTDLSARDALNAFNWICTEQSGQVVFYSTGLKPSVGLGHLLLAEAFRSNRVEVAHQGQPVARSIDHVWWDNPVLPLPSNSGGAASAVVLDQPGAVYTLASSRETNGYAIKADQVAVVTLPGTVLTLRSGAAASCNTHTGQNTPPASPDDDDLKYWRSAILCGGSRQFLWLEGEYDNPPGVASPDNYATGIVLVRGFRSVLRRLSVQNGGYGLVLYDSSANLLYDIRVANHARYGMILGGGWASGRAHDNIVARLFATNIGSNGGHASLLVDRRASDNVFTQILLSHGTPWCLFQFDSSTDNNIYSHVTASSCWRGIDLGGSDNVVFVQGVATNSAQDGVYLRAQLKNTRLAQLVSAHNGGRGLMMETGTTNTTFSGNVLVGGNALGECLGCDFTGANVKRGVDLSRSFVGRVTSDVKNTGPTALLPRASVTDWLHFDSAYRGWGQESVSFPQPAVLDKRCTGTEACRIWDWRLDAQDTELLHRSGNGNTVNASFVESGVCPAAVHGDSAISDEAGQVTFLMNATELFFDGVGNDNGLCESNEACVYSPHFGAYQGEGALSDSTCIFQDGTVSGVSLYAHSRLTP